MHWLNCMKKPRRPLRKRLFNMKMSEGGSIIDHLNEFNTVTNQLRSVKVYFDDEVRALLILCSLP
jgi:hypothetical protein